MHGRADIIVRKVPLVLIKSDPKAREKPCLRCGYSLRKIGDARHCPECGLSVWVSLNQNDSLDWSRPDWLQLISWGAWLMAAAQVAGIAFGVMMLSPAGNYSLKSLLVGTYLLMLHAGMIALAIPERRYPDKWKGFRWFISIVGALGLIVGAAMFVYGLGGPRRWGWSLVLVEFVVLIGAVATLLYLRKLAHRLGSHRLAKVLGWLLLIPLLKFVQAFPFWGISLAYGFFGFGELLPWLYIPISLGILIYLGIGFRKAAKAAEVNWASAG